MKFHGLDTETVNGAAMIIATEKDWTTVGCFQDVARFLFNKKNRGHAFFTWNLGYDARAIIKWLPFVLWDDLYHSIRTEYNGIRIYYIQDKLFSIGKGKNTSTLYDIAQFYNRKSLDSQADFYFGEHKQDKAHWTEYVNEHPDLEEQVRYLNEHQAEIGEYCRLDAELTYKLGNLMKDSFEGLGVSFNKPISGGSLAKRYLMKNTEYPVTWKSNALNLFARSAYHGGIFSTHKLGIYHDVWDYDINSAYPYEMLNLPNWDNGEYRLNIEKPSDTPYGWYECEFDCEWIPYETDYKIFYPIGKRKQWITRKEYDWMKEHGYECEFIQGHEWIQTKEEFESPFSWIDKMYKERQRIKTEHPEDIREKAIKLLINSTYGKTAQHKPSETEVTNYMYASYITAGTRLQIADIANEYYDSVIQIATDGIMLEEEIGLPISRKIGDWEVNRYDKVLVLGSGRYQAFNGEEYFTKLRGITGRRDYDLLRKCEENKDKDVITYSRETPLPLFMVLAEAMFKPTQMNVFMSRNREIKLNSDDKRRWTRRYRNFGDLLKHPCDSKPYKVRQLEKYIRR
jgi:hypothetical protein